VLLRNCSKFLERLIYEFSHAIPEVVLSEFTGLIDYLGGAMSCLLTGKFFEDLELIL
jgi:hypothetical protein